MVFRSEAAWHCGPGRAGLAIHVTVTTSTAAAGQTPGAGPAGIGAARRNRCKALQRGSLIGAFARDCRSGIRCAAVGVDSARWEAAAAAGICAGASAQEGEQWHSLLSALLPML